MAKLTNEQKELFNKLPSKLQKEICLNFIKQDFNNQTLAYTKACKKLKRKPSVQPDAAASNIFRDLRVQSFLNSVRQKAETEEAEIVVGSFEHKRQMLLEVAQRCNQHNPVLDKKGQQVFVLHTDKETGEEEYRALYGFEYKGVVSAISELNKMDGDHAAQRVDLGATEDLVHLIQAGRSRASKSD